MIIFSDQKLYIGKVLAIYENISGKHAYISYNITNIDAISYISVSLFVDIYNGSIFTNDCQIGGKLFAHITPKEVVYYFENLIQLLFKIIHQRVLSRYILKMRHYNTHSPDIVKRYGIAVNHLLYNK